MGEIPIWLALYAALIHYLADFPLQPHAIAQAKGRCWKALLTHVAQYGAVFLVAFAPLGLWAVAPGAALAHLAVDSWSARLSGWAYREGRMKLFWCVIGGDQALHQALNLVVLVWVWGGLR